MSINLEAEKYRKLAFLPDQLGNDFGCYTTFEISPDFKQIFFDKEKKQTHKKNIKRMARFIALQEDIPFEDYVEFNSENNYEDICYVFKEYLTLLFSNRFYYSEKYKLYMSYFWDGDGILVFIDENGIFLNTDCKKDYNWEFYPF